MQAGRRISTFSTLLLLMLALFPRGPVEPAGVPHDAGVRPPVTVVLTSDGSPGLHRTVRLTARVTPEVQTDGLTVSWILPAGVTLAGSSTELLGSAEAGQTLSTSRDVTFDQEGTFQVSAHAQMQTGDPAFHWGHTDDLYFTIQAGPGSRVSSRGPGIASTSELIATPGAHTTETAHPEQGYWVRGRFMYLDVPVTSGGAGAPVLVPARQVLVEIWEDDLIFDDHDGSTRTDDNGYFEFWDPDNDDGWFGGDKETYLKIYPNTPGAYVTDRSWIDDEYYCYTGNQTGGHDIDFGTMTPTNFHRMFSISDALLDAYRYALQFRGSIGKAKVQYEPGYGEDTSFYDSFWNEITLADAGGDDGYDDAVLQHEYGHWVANNYACDDSDGGHHTLTGHYDNDLAWSEGWASYLSSAIRNDPWYLDWDYSSSNWSVSANWETWSGSTGSDNESAVVATLWDIHDSVDETHDRLSLGGGDIWHTFDDRMQDSDDCTIYGFWDEWLAAGYPDDSELAAIFAHYNTAGLHTALAGPAEPQERLVPPGSLPAQVIQVAAPADRGSRPAQAAPDAIVQGGLPWNAVLFLPDATNSMAAEIGAVRQIIQDKVNDMDAEPYPYEYTVETFQDNGVNTLVVDHFFPDVVNPPVGAITVGGGGDPEEDSFAALARGTVGCLGYDAWLFTDAAPKTVPTGAELAGLLQSRQVTPYFFIFGDCSGGNKAGETAGTKTPSLAPPGRLHLPRFSPEGLEECVEPFLLVAGDTNGQLLLIDTSQIADAAEIVRAFMSNNAGAGRYANYVSTGWAYTWDDTTYDWYDATATGDYYNIYFDSSQTVALPQPFSFYNNPYSTLYVADRGYVSFSNNPVNGDNTGIPTAATPNNAIYGFWDDIAVYVIGEGTEQCTGAYSEDDSANHRFVVEYCEAYHPNIVDEETFEIVLDYDTGEITLQYQQVTDDSSCTVGVENAAGTQATQVIYDNPGSLYAGRAIKLTPLPPHPYNDHEVVVDSTMSGVIFLLNGYSGDVDLTVYRPNGTPVDPSDPGVTFLDVGRIKYYRVSDPEEGTWIARASGNGTYYFTSSATSPLDSDYQGDQTMSSFVLYNLLVDLGMPVNSASFSLVYPDGSLFDTPTLYDDGGHNDGGAGDGLYGGWYNAPGNGTVYLQVDGQTLGGETFRRTDLTPLRFQGMELITPYPAEQFALPGATIIYTYTLWNDSDTAQLFVPQLQSSQGWASTPWYLYLVAAHSSVPVVVTVAVPLTAWNVTERSTLTMLGVDMADSGTVATTVRGWPTSIELRALPDRIAPNGHTSVIVAHVLDDLGWNVADGTLVQFSTDLGTLDPLQGTTVSGLMTTTLTSGAATGVATVQAIAGNATGETTVAIDVAPAHTITLAADSYQLPPDGTSTTGLTAHVTDEYGAMAPDGTTVVFAVGGDELNMGSIDGQEMYTTTTSGGVATAVYRSGTQSGLAQVYAGIPLGGTSGAGEGTLSMRWTSINIALGQAYSIYLPIVIKGAP
jgi:hypothetical protein